MVAELARPGLAGAVVKLTVYLVMEGPDFRGRHLFWGFWWGLVGRKGDQHGVRGQIFRTNLQDHLRIVPLDGRSRKTEVLDLRDLGGISEQEAVRRCTDMVKDAQKKGRAVAC